jgi:8-oxo-dGTP pyrophosphatase MutT (NUDIX family)
MNEDIYQLGIKALIKNSAKKILLLQTNVKQLKGFKGRPYWDIPGGRIQVGKTVEETLRREIEEETGLTKVKVTKHVGMTLSPIRIPINKKLSSGLILSVYECRVNGAPNISISEEHIGYKWCSLSEAKKLLAFKYPKEFLALLK